MVNQETYKFKAAGPLWHMKTSQLAKYYHSLLNSIQLVCGAVWCNNGCRCYPGCEREWEQQRVARGCPCLGSYANGVWEGRADEERKTLRASRTPVFRTLRWSKKSTVQGGGKYHLLIYIYIFLFFSFLFCYLLVSSLLSIILFSQI